MRKVPQQSIFEKSTLDFTKSNPRGAKRRGGCVLLLSAYRLLLTTHHIPIRTGMTIGALLVRWKRNPAMTSVRLFFT